MTKSNVKPPARFEFDVNFQEKLVRMLYQDEGFAASASEFFKPELFENPVHRWVAKKIMWCNNSLGHHITPTVLQCERKKDERMGIIRPQQRLAFKEFLSQRICKPVPDKTYLKQETQRFIKNQMMEAFVLEAAEDLLPRGDFDEMTKKVLRWLEVDLTQNNSIGSFLGKTWQTRQKLRKLLKLNGITTGIPSIDKLMKQEGMSPKQLGCFIAPTGRGKTNILINLASCAVLENVPTLYITLELAQEQIEERFDARLTHIPIKLLRTNEDAFSDGWEKLEGQVADNLVIKEFPTGQFTVPMLRAYLKRLERHAFYPKLVVIDYADLMRARVEFSDSSNETLGSIYLDLRGLAMELNILIWTASQSNRSGMLNESGDVGMGNAADGIKKTHIADAVVCLQQSAKEKAEGRMRALLDKNRNGPSGREVPLKVDHATAMFTECGPSRKAEAVLNDFKQKAKAKMKKAA